ncbi:hypothetical protein C8N36_106193 [Pelagimonas varians]|uniref:Uncharacterized protein n=1 Tax=Pelagimonas varians TaxID=696760 RepID=A0A238K3L7_9RHOB|nr:hypothetical protein C8N36_106193 [Pelagimonas varians]SMX37480.1 hypothetical protein PEV8663_01097 [Pelagimonas varians]
MFKRFQNCFAQEGGLACEIRTGKRFAMAVLRKTNGGLVEYRTAQETALPSLNRQTPSDKWRVA